ncbi:hypothetical protein DL93DRAFT_2073714 [Clavulina sp. PMI_390]|nr:hypothetical protein DL93DRAFT_2073714 [Clavulina sp. PMI_390]
MSKPKESVHDRVLGSLLAPLTGGAGSKSSANAPTSASAAFPNGPEDVFNPASGAHAGVLRATAADTTTSATTPGPHPNGATETPKEKEIDPVQAHADMWAQLSKIRVLQSDIAKMHLALDRPGIVESSSAASAGDARKASRHSARTETLMTNAATLATSAGRSGTMGTHQSLGGAIGSPLSPATMGTGFGTIPHQPKSQSTDDAVVDEFARRKEAIGSIMAKVSPR